MRLRLATVLLSLATLLTVTSCGSDTNANTSVTVMTRNMYLGADLTPLFTPSATPLPVLVEQAWGQVVASQPNLRAQTIAGEIHAANPDLVGLQEVATWYSGVCDTPGVCPLQAGQTAPQPATHVEYDFLATVLATLQQLGTPYEVAAEVSNFGAEFPGTANGVTFTDRRYQDRDVILKRVGLETSNPQHGNFPPDHSLPVSVAGQQIVITRGWAYVDVVKNGVSFRFATSHPEAYNLPIPNGLGPNGTDLPPDSVRAAQIVDLVAAVGPQRPTILVGDMNSDPADPNERGYQYLTATPVTGYVDLWPIVQSRDPGYSCCFDASLTSGSLTQRIDLILVRGSLQGGGAQRLGTGYEVVIPPATTPSMYPSDHAGVAATIQIEEK
jgi:endonuclease/exonuclease/phosphatase family metal-dependent hydrolase